jgi:hypothetical protein
VSPATTASDYKERIELAGAAALGAGISYAIYANTAHELFPVPLIEITNHHGVVYSIMVTKLLLLVGSLFYADTKRDHSKWRQFLLGATALSSAWIWLVWYSWSGAFIPSLIISCAFFAFALKSSVAEPERSGHGNAVRKIASLMLGMTFILAAIQKLNGDYLYGGEFSRDGAFFTSLYLWGLPYDAIVPNGTPQASVLPILSILIELMIGVGVILASRIFSQLALIFVLLLAPIVPNILFVYLILFPFVILSDDFLWKTVRNSSLYTAIRTPFSWTFIAIFVRVGDSNVAAISVKVWFPALLLLGAHITIFAASMKLPRHNSEPTAAKLFTKSLAADLVQRPIFIGPVLMILSFLSFYFGAPSPIGYSMFSAQRYRPPLHEVRIHDPSACDFIQRTTPVFHVTDTKISFDGQTCVISHPTASGISSLTSRICDQRQNLTWEKRVTPSSEWSRSNCLERSGKYN